MHGRAQADHPSKAGKEDQETGGRAGEATAGDGGCRNH